VSETVQSTNYTLRIRNTIKTRRTLVKKIGDSHLEFCLKTIMEGLVSIIPETEASNCPISTLQLKAVVGALHRWCWSRLRLPAQVRTRRHRRQDDGHLGSRCLEFRDLAV
jgi:hypothetical protein